MQIAEIKKRFQTRKINPAYVEFLASDFKENGFKNAYPVSITTDGVLWDGNHRVEAAIMVGLTDVPHIIEDPENMRFEAHERNRVSTNALPETFVDHAEEIWDLLAIGKTQQQVADEMGWGLSPVKSYSRLDKLSPIIWEKVSRSARSETFKRDSSETNKVSLETLSEGLLRNVLNLTEYHQSSIIEAFISGKIKNGKVKTLAKTYAERESFAEYAIDGLVCLDDVHIFFNDCFNGLYKTIEQVKKAVKQANDEFEKHNSIRLIPGDCFEILKNDVKDGSCDALITDPPYAILKEDWDSFKSKTEFLKFSREWIALAASKIKSTGRLYIFWSQEFMFDFPFDAIPERFTFGNMLVWNYKNNIKPSNQKKYKYTYEPCFYFYGEDAVKLNLPNDKDWDSDTNDYDVFEFAQPQSNFKDDPKEHPAQKPRKLINQLVNIGSDIGDTVLDCFAGSGTTGVCCKNLKRKAVLIEKDESYLKIISRRLNE